MPSKRLPDPFSSKSSIGLMPSPAFRVMEASKVEMKKLPTSTHTPTGGDTATTTTTATTTGFTPSRSPVMAIQRGMDKYLDYSPAKQKELLMEWLNTVLINCYVGYKNEKEERASLKEQKEDLRSNINEFKKEMKKVGEAVDKGEAEFDEVPVKEAVDGLGAISEISVEISVEGVKGFVEGVTDALPFVGLATSMIRTVGLSLKALWSIKKMMDAEKGFDKSEYIMQQESWIGAMEYRRYKGKIDTLDLAAAAAKLGTNLIPVAGSVLSAATSATKAMLKIMILLEAENQRVALNKKIKSGQLNYEDLDEHPILRLMIPHYPQFDFLGLIGAVPPNWQVALSGNTEAIKRMNNILTNGSNLWIYNTLYTETANIKKKDDFPVQWQTTIEHLANTFEETNSLLFEMPYALRKIKEIGKPSIVVYEAPPQGVIQVIQSVIESAKDGIINFFKSLVGKGESKPVKDRVDTLRYRPGYEHPKGGWVEYDAVLEDV